MPTKGLQERGNGSADEVGITLEAPCVARQQHTRRKQAPQGEGGVRLVGTSGAEEREVAEPREAHLCLYSPRVSFYYSWYKLCVFLLFVVPIARLSIFVVQIVCLSIIRGTSGAEESEVAEPRKTPLYPYTHRVFLLFVVQIVRLYIIRGTNRASF